MILYLHGFASHGNGNKSKLLKEYFKNEKVISPTLPVDPLDAIKFIDEIIEVYKDENNIVIGTSLGGFYTFYTSAKYKIKGVLINPSFEPWVTLRNSIGLNKRFDTNEEFIWKEEYLDSLEKIYNDAKQNCDESLLNFFLAEDDELLDHSKIIEKFPKANTIKYYKNMSHRFNNFEIILPEIEKIKKN